MLMPDLPVLSFCSLALMQLLLHFSLIASRIQLSKSHDHSGPWADLSWSKDCPESRGDAGHQHQAQVLLFLCVLKNLMNSMLESTNEVFFYLPPSWEMSPGRMLQGRKMNLSDPQLDEHESGTTNINFSLPGNFYFC